MGRICFKLDDHGEQILRQESKTAGISLSDFIRNKLFSTVESAQQKNLLEVFHLSNRKFSISELKSKLQVLQNKIDLEEQKVNCEIGAWVRQQTNVDSLKDFQLNFIISPQKNKSQTEKDDEKIFLTAPLKSVPNEEKIEDKQLNF